jgi:hypothetical protein
VIKKLQRRRPRPDLGCRAIGWMDGCTIDQKMVAGHGLICAPTLFILRLILKALIALGRKLSAVVFNNYYIRVLRPRRLDEAQSYEL